MISWATTLLPLLTALAGGLLVYWTGERRAQADYQRQLDAKRLDREEAERKERRQRLATMYQPVLEALLETLDAVSAHTVLLSTSDSDAHNLRFLNFVQKFSDQMLRAMLPLRLDASGNRIIEAIRPVQHQAWGLLMHYLAWWRMHGKPTAWPEFQREAQRLMDSVEVLASIMRESLDRPDDSLPLLANSARQHRVESEKELVQALGQNAPTD